MQAWWAEETYFKDIKKNLRLSIKVSLSMDFIYLLWNLYHYWLIAINRIQNKSFCLHNMCILCIFIMYT